MCVLSWQSETIWLFIILTFRKNSEKNLKNFSKNISGKFLKTISEIFLKKYSDKIFAKKSVKFLKNLWKISEKIENSVKFFKKILLTEIFNRNPPSYFLATLINSQIIFFVVFELKWPLFSFKVGLIYGYFQRIFSFTGFFGHLTTIFRKFTISSQ